MSGRPESTRWALAATERGGVACPKPDSLLGPGDVFLLRRGDGVQTLLGSCVAIILTDPARTLATICHFVHASPSRGALDDTCHADAALRRMCELLGQQALNPARCEAFVYGGANMFPGIYSGRHVGEANSRWAFEALARLGVAVHGCDVGGQAYRCLRWRLGPEAPRVSLGGYAPEARA